MIIGGMTEKQIREGVRLVDNAQVQSMGRRGNQYRVKLTVDSTKDGERLYRLSPGGRGRKMHALCWHGFRAVMREWFRLCPDARIYTAMATYKGSDDFEMHHDITGNANIGSQFFPMKVRDACDC